MALRLFNAACLVVVLITLLSFVASVSAYKEDASGAVTAQLANGELTYHAGPGRSTKTAAESRYAASVSPNAADASSLFAKPVWQPGLTSRIELPLGWVAVAAVALPLLIYLLKWRRIARRHRRGWCLRCGYNLRESGEICPECAMPRAIGAPRRWPVTIIPSLSAVVGLLSRAALLFGIVVILVCGGIGWTGRLARLAHDRFVLAGLDITHFVTATSPHLTGDVSHIAFQAPIQTITSSDVAPGELLLLDEGRYAFSPTTSVRDIAIVGISPQKTTLSLHLNWANRLRLENLTIDCKNSEFLDFRTGGSVSLKNCVIFNYNSGAGGSNAISASDSVLLIDNCTFNGSEGRAKSPSRFGNAFDLRGSNQVYARHTTFIDNAEIARGNSITFDECTDRIASGARRFVYSSGARFVRNSPTLIVTFPLPGLDAFQLPMDDPAFVQRVLDRSGQIDPMSRRVIDCFDPAKSPAYWLGLMRSDRPEIRQIAVKRLAALGHPPMAIDAADKAHMAELLKALDGGQSPDALRARLGLIRATPEVAQAMTEQAGTLSAQGQEQVNQILRLRQLPVPLDVEVEYNRLEAEIRP